MAKNEGMAKSNPTWFQRLTAGFRALSSGEGEGTAARLGRSVRQTTAKLKTMLGIAGPGDAFEGSAGTDRRRAAQRLIGAERVAFVEKDGLKGRDLNATVEKEFRGQVASGLTAASTRAVGSSLMDAPGWEDSPDGQV